MLEKASFLQWLKCILTGHPMYANGDNGRTFEICRCGHRKLYSDGEEVFRKQYDLVVNLLTVATLIATVEFYVISLWREDVEVFCGVLLNLIVIVLLGASLTRNWWFLDPRKSRQRVVFTLEIMNICNMLFLIEVLVRKCSSFWVCLVLGTIHFVPFGIASILEWKISREDTQN